MAGMNLECREIASLARKLRVQTARMIHRAKSSHLGSAYSMVDLLAVLYGRILRIDPKRPEAAERDRFVLRKGHACAALYAVVAGRGFFPEEWLEDFYRGGARLAGHAQDAGVTWGGVVTGSLGHARPIARR